jgi:hypothetical protein
VKMKTTSMVRTLRITNADAGTSPMTKKHALIKLALIYL